MPVDTHSTNTPSELEKYEYILELLDIGARYTRFSDLDKQLSKSLLGFVLSPAAKANKGIHIRSMSELKALQMYSGFIMGCLKDCVQGLLKTSNAETTARQLAYVTAVYLRYIQPVIDYVEGNANGSSRYLPIKSEDILKNFVGIDSNGKTVGKIFATTEPVFGVNIPDTVRVFENTVSIIKSETVNNFVYRGLCVLIGVDYNEVVRQRREKAKQDAKIDKVTSKHKAKPLTFETKSKASSLDKKRSKPEATKNNKLATQSRASSQPHSPTSKKLKQRRTTTPLAIASLEPAQSDSLTVNVPQPNTVPANAMVVPKNVSDSFQPPVAKREDIASQSAMPHAPLVNTNAQPAAKLKRPILRADIRAACERLTADVCHSIRAEVPVLNHVISTSHAAVIGSLGSGHDLSICNSARVLLHQTPQLPILLDLAHIQPDANIRLTELAVVRLKPYLPEDKDLDSAFELIQEMILSGDIKILIPQTWHLPANQFNRLAAELRRTPRWALALQDWNTAGRIAQDVDTEWMPKPKHSEIYAALMEIQSESSRLTAERAIATYQSLPASRLFIVSVIATLKKTRCHTISLANEYLNRLAALVGWPGRTQDFVDIFAAIALLDSLSTAQADLSTQTIHEHLNAINMRIDSATLATVLRYAVRANLMKTEGGKFRFTWLPYLLREVSGIAWARLLDLRSPDFWLLKVPLDTITQGIIFLADTRRQPQIAGLAAYLREQLSLENRSSKTFASWAAKTIFAKKLVERSYIENVREIDKFEYLLVTVLPHLAPSFTNKYDFLSSLAIQALKSDIVATVIIADVKPSKQWELVSKRAAQLAAISPSALSSWIQQLLDTTNTKCQEIGLHLAKHSQDENILISTEKCWATRNKDVKQALIECWCIWHARLTHRLDHENRMTELYASESDLKTLIIANLIATNQVASIDFAVRLAGGSRNRVFDAIGRLPNLSSAYVLQTVAKYAREKLALNPDAGMRACLEMLERNGRLID